MKTIVSVLSARLRALTLVVLATATCLITGCSGESVPTSPVVSSPTLLAIATSTPEATQTLARQMPTETTPATKSGSAVFAGDTIKIGVDLPTTYQGAPQPDIVNVRDTVQLAIEQANAAGGVIIAGKKYKLEMYALDDQIDPQIGAKNAETFVADPAVLAVVGPFNSNVAPADMPIFNRASLAQISPSNTHPSLTRPQYGQIGDLRPTGKLTYFRVLTSDDMQGPAGADYLYDKLGARKIYILDDDGDYGKGLADNVARRFREDGGTVLGREIVPSNTQDFQPILKKAVGTKADALYYAGTLDRGPGLVRKQMVEMGFNIPFVGGDGILAPPFVSDAGATAEGSYATTVAVNPMALPTARQFLADYKAHFGKEPTMGDASSYAPPAYDAANIIIAAMKRASAPNRESVCQQIAATKDYQGTLGTMSFDENGDTTNRLLSVYKVKDGAWAFLEHVNYQGTLP